MKITDEKTKEALSQAAKLLGADEITVSFVTEPNSCDKQCTGCEGQTHHWLEGFEEDDGEIINPENPLWKCKHCEYSIPYSEPDKHPSGCDCPDCDCSQHWLCMCGNYIEDGLHCDECGGEPPWGCDCSMHDAEDEDDFSYSDLEDFY